MEFIHVTWRRIVHDATDNQWPFSSNHVWKTNNLSCQATNCPASIGQHFRVLKIDRVPRFSCIHRCIPIGNGATTRPRLTSTSMPIMQTLIILEECICVIHGTGILLGLPPIMLKSIRCFICCVKVFPQHYFRVISSCTWTIYNSYAALCYLHNISSLPSAPFSYMYFFRV